nr:lipopolysaccharide assembly protein LapA domain-containing protein [uncultured Desulfuromonas sp.]
MKNAIFKSSQNHRVVNEPDYFGRPSMGYTSLLVKARYKTLFGGKISMKFVKLFLALVGLALVFIFCKDNDTKVVIRFLDYQTPEIYLFLMIITTFVLGMISASFANTIKIMQLKRQLRQLQPEGTDDEKESKTEKKKDRKARKQDKKTDASEVKPAESEATTVIEEQPAPVIEETPAAPRTEEVSDAVYEEPAPSDSPKEEPPQVIELPQGPVEDAQPEEQVQDETQSKQS